MDQKRKKSINIDTDTHQSIALASVQTGKDMYELMAKAWREYQKLAAHTATPTMVPVEPVLKPEQCLTCPVCESTLYLTQSGSTKELGLKVVPGSEHKKTLNSDDVSYSFTEQERRAVEMLTGILRGHSTRIRSAILSNLDAFALHADKPDPLDAVSIENLPTAELRRVGEDLEGMQDTKTPAKGDRKPRGRRGAGNSSARSA